MTALLLLAACGDNLAGAPCEPGETAQCACTDGTSSTQVCRDDGTLSPCDCGSGLGEPPEPDAGPTDPVIGNCDDGSFDPGDVCAVDSLVGGAYLHGTRIEGQCGYDYLERFWPPELPAARVGPFGCNVDQWLFRESDGAFFYRSVFDGLRAFDGDTDPVVPTPPCGDDVKPPVSFDGANRLYYRCGLDVYRDGSVLRAGAELVAALGDGRAILLEESQGGLRDDYVVIDESGAEISRLSPHAEIDKLTAEPTGVTVYGNVAYVLYRRIDAVALHEPVRELVSFRLSESSEWEPSRRALIDTFFWQQASRDPLVLADGTMVLRETDPDADLTVDPLSDRIRVFQADGTVIVSWREETSTYLFSHGHVGIIAGP